MGNGIVHLPNGRIVNGIIRLDPDGHWDQSFELESVYRNGVVGEIHALGMLPGGDVLFGGGFDRVDYVPVSVLGRVKGGFFPLFESVSLTDRNEVFIDFFAPLNHAYRLESSVNFDHWVFEFEGVASQTPRGWRMANDGLDVRRFYRIVDNR